MSETNMSEKIAQRRLQVFEYQFGSGTLRLAYHAALPIVLNRELLHLMRTNFFASSAKESLPDSAETDLLLSPLCQKIGVDDLYEMEPAVRELLLKRLATEYSDEHLRQVATLLLEYTEGDTPWRDNVWLQLTQKLTALRISDPEKIQEWFDWSKAMRKEVARLTKIINQDEQSAVNLELLTP